MEFEELLVNLGGKVGIPDLAPDEDGTCRLSLDNMIVDMKVAGDKNHLLLFGEVSPLPVERQDELIAQILGANFLFTATNGATLGMDVSTKTIYLQQKEALAFLNDAEFETLLTEFVNTIERWKKLIEEYLQTLPEKSDKEEEEGFTLTTSAGFFRV